MAIDLNTDSGVPGRAVPLPMNKGWLDNLGGLLFGGGGTDGLEGYLSQQQQDAIQRQAMMQAAAALLKSSGRTTQPISLGQALGGAFEAGTAGYQGAQQNAIQQLLTKQKLDEMKRAQQAQQAYQNFLLGQPTAGEVITPDQAISAPDMAIGPTVERAALIGQPISSATMPSAGTALSPQMQKLLSFLPPEKGIPEAIKMMQPQKTTGQPFRAADGKYYVMTETGGVVPAPVAPEAKPTGQPQEVIVGGKPALVQYYEDGSYKVVSGVTPKIKTTGQPFKGVDEKYYIQTETGDVIPAPVAPAPEITGQAFKGADGNYYYMTKQGPIPATIAPADLAAEEFSAPQPQVIDGQIQMVQYNKYGQRRVVPGAMPYEPQSQDIRAVEYIQGKPLAGTGEAGIGAVGQYRQQIAPKTTVTVPVDMTGGQKGFENEMSLGKAFRSEPIYKDFNDMKSAFTQVVSSFKQGTPIGDVAGATKIMKLLDPGSVVRESELAIAMQAGGRLDRLQNYFNMWASGEKLTPTQRDDFQALANELYAAAGQAYNQKRAEYESFGRSYGFKNLDTALGAQATLPSIVKKPTANAPAGAAKPKVGKLVTDPKTGVTRYVEE